MEEPIAQEVNASGGNREHLVVLFNSEFQIVFEVGGYFFQQDMQIRFIMMKDHQIIGIPEIKTNSLYLFKPMIEIGKVEIGEVLA